MFDMDYKFHHIGIATNDLEQTASILSMFGYVSEDVQYDPLQNVNVRFLHHEQNPLIELIEGVDGASPVQNLLKKNGTCVYHLCYEVEDIDEALSQMREDGYIPTCEKTKSVIGGRDVIFLYHPHNCLIELLEGKKHDNFKKNPE